MLLHLDRKPDPILKNEPEVGPLVLKLLGVPVPQLVLSLDLTIQDFLPLLKAKGEVIFDNLGLANALLAGLVLVNSDDAVVGREAEFGAAI